MNEKYIPLYRKYRPQTLEEIVGQEHIKRALANAITTGRITHAYLFTGPRGTGKTSTARIFAKSLNCESGPTVTPCGKCSNCTDITNSVPMDVIEIDAASNRKVEDAQNILEKVMYAPVKSRYKIYIIDEVHMLSNTAFNALLKTLEEPPKNVIFILATTEVHKVLDTIKSRCQRFDFKRITTEDIVEHLKHISKSEKINITEDALLSIAKNSAGGMRDSIALLDQLSILNGEKPISSDDINILLGRISYDNIKPIVDGIVQSAPQTAIYALEKIYNSGNEPVQILSSLLDYIKNMLIIKTCSTEITQELTELNDSQIKELSEQNKELETHQIMSLIESVSEYIKIVKSTNNPRLWLEVGIIDLANLAENTTLKDLQDRITRLENGNPGQNQKVFFKNISTEEIKENLKNLSTQKDSSKPLDNPQEEPILIQKDTESLPVQESNNKDATPDTSDFSPMPKAKSLSQDDISVLWAKLLSNINSVPTVTLLKQWANPVKITPEETILSIKTELFLNRINSGNKKELVIEAIDKLFGQKNSNVIIRLPLPDDEAVKPAPIKAATSAHQVPPKDEEISAEELIEDIETNNPTAQEEKVSEQRTKYNEHSDQVNMVVDLFDGKVID